MNKCNKDFIITDKFLHCIFYHYSYGSMLYRSVPYNIESNILEYSQCISYMGFMIGKSYNSFCDEIINLTKIINRLLSFGHAKPTLDPSNYDVDEIYYNEEDDRYYINIGHDTNHERKVICDSNFNILNMLEGVFAVEKRSSHFNLEHNWKYDENQNLTHYDMVLHNLGSLKKYRFTYNTLGEMEQYYCVSSTDNLIFKFNNGKVASKILYSHNNYYTEDFTNGKLSELIFYNYHDDGIIIDVDNYNINNEDTFSCERYRTYMLDHNHYIVEFDTFIDYYLGDGEFTAYWIDDIINKKVYPSMVQSITDERYGIKIFLKQDGSLNNRIYKYNNDKMLEFVNDMKIIYESDGRTISKIVCDIENEVWYERKNLD